MLSINTLSTIQFFFFFYLKHGPHAENLESYIKVFEILVSLHQNVFQFFMLSRYVAPQAMPCPERKYDK